MQVASLITEYGFNVVAIVFLGYFVYYVWQFVTMTLNPALGKMHIALIRVIDQTRMLDQDMIRLQQKVNVVITMKEKIDIINDAEEKEALAERKKNDKKD